MSLQSKRPAVAPLATRLALVYIEERAMGGTWVRQRRFGVPLHPVYGAQQVKLLKKIHPGTEYRLVEVNYDDIPF